MRISDRVKIRKRNKLIKEFVLAAAMIGLALLIGGFVTFAAYVEAVTK